MKKLLNTLYVTTKDAYISLDGENIVIQIEGKESGRVPFHNIEAVVTFGYLGASPALMGACAERDISLCFLSGNGKFMARISGEVRGNVLLRKQQYRISDKPEDVIIEEVMYEDKLKIADEVMETIAGIETAKIPCVAAMSGGFTDGLAGILGKKNLGKGVRVETTENEVKVFITMTVEYGCKIHMVAREVQNAVRVSIQEMTGMNVTEVNINVVGICVPKESKESKEIKKEREAEIRE